MFRSHVIRRTVMAYYYAIVGEPSVAKRSVINELFRVNFVSSFREICYVVTPAFLLDSVATIESTILEIFNI